MKINKEEMRSKHFIELSEMLKAMAHPSRMAIMFLLCNNDNRRMTVKSIYNELKLAQPVISRHLGILKNSGLVQRITEGQNTFYELNEKNETVKHISKCFSTLPMNK